MLDGWSREAAGTLGTPDYIYTKGRTGLPWGGLMGGDSKHGDTRTLDCIHIDDTITVTMGSIRKAVAIEAGKGWGGRALESSVEKAVWALE